MACADFRLVQSTGVCFAPGMPGPQVPVLLPELSGPGACAVPRFVWSTVVCATPGIVCFTGASAALGTEGSTGACAAPRIVWSAGVCAAPRIFCFTGVLPLQELCGLQGPVLLIELCGLQGA